MDDLYQETILDHYKHPRNFKPLEPADLTVAETNQSCGDSFTFFLRISPQGVINQLTFTGQGCAISTAAASMLTQELAGKPLQRLAALDLSSMKRLLHVPITPAREKCLMLPAVALKKAAGETRK